MKYFNFLSISKQVVFVTILLVSNIPNEVRAHASLDKQITTFSNRIKESPNEAKLYLYRADKYRLHEQYDLAFQDLARAEQLNASIEFIYFNRGQIYFAQQDFEHAKIEMQKYLKIKPNTEKANILYAEILSSLKDYQASEAIYRYILPKIESPKPDYYIDYAQVHINQGGSIIDAINIIENGIDKIGSIISLDMAALNFELEAQQYTNALKRIEKISFNRTRKEKWLKRKGDIYLLMNEPEKSLQHYQSALSAIKKLSDNTRKQPATKRLLQEINHAIETSKSIPAQTNV